MIKKMVFNVITIVMMGMITLFIGSSFNAEALAKPKYGGVLKIGDVSPPIGPVGWMADPLSSMNGTLVDGMIETLVYVDANLKMIPQLATKWEIADDLKSVKC